MPPGRPLAKVKAEDLGAYRAVRQHATSNMGCCEPRKASLEPQVAADKTHKAVIASSSEETVGLAVSRTYQPSSAAPPDQAPGASDSRGGAVRPPPSGPPPRRDGARKKRSGHKRVATSVPVGIDPTKCEDCHKRVRTFSEPGETEMRWCAKCVQDNRHPGAVRVKLPTKRENNICEDCNKKHAHYGEPATKKRRWCKSCVDIHGHTAAVCLTRNKMCEDCGEKQANFGEQADMKKRWCSACVKANGYTAVNVCGHKKCEVCNVKFASYGMPTEGKRRWCVDCTKREPALSALGCAKPVYCNGIPCKDCGVLAPSYGDPTERKRAWCFECAKKNHPDAVAIAYGKPKESCSAYARKKCELCTTKIATHGYAGERKRRWCASCARDHPQHSGDSVLVNLNRSVCQDCNQKTAKYGLATPSSLQRKRKLWCSVCVIDHPEAEAHPDQATCADLGIISERFKQFKQSAESNEDDDADKQHPPDEEGDSPTATDLPTLAEDDLPNNDDNARDRGSGKTDSGGATCLESVSVRLSQSVAGQDHQQPYVSAPDSPAGSLASPQPLISRTNHDQVSNKFSLLESDRLATGDILTQAGEHAPASCKQADFPTPSLIALAKPRSASGSDDAAQGDFNSYAETWPQYG